MRRGTGRRVGKGRGAPRRGLKATPPSLGLEGRISPYSGAGRTFVGHDGGGGAIQVMAPIVAALPQENLGRSTVRLLHMGTDVVLATVRSGVRTLAFNYPGTVI